MGLLAKVRILAEALLRKPFAPKREKASLEEGAPTRQAGLPKQGALREERASVPDSERVADLIAQRQQGQNRS
jgi:hypothetical protein